MRLRLLHLGFTFTFLLVSAAVPGSAEAKPPPKRAKLEPPPKRLVPEAKSIGSPTEGHLVGGSRLGDAPYLRIVPVYAPGDVRWGVEPLVSAIERAARLVRKQFPDAVLSVGHLSKPGGGQLDRHASHESGRDADIGFYVKNERGKPVYADHFVQFKGDGTAPTWPGAHFDDARNWAFIAAMVGNGRARITHIFVSTPIRKRLLAYAAKIGAPAALRVRASELMAQPRGSLPHDDHFHIRVACPSGMNKCIELPTARHRKRSPPSATAKATPARAKPKHTPAKPAPPPVKSDATSGSSGAEEKDDAQAEESAAGDTFPSLAPIVPGLDSAVIPKPLEIPPAPREVPPPAPSVAPPAIDDPDGVLEEPR